MKELIRKYKISKILNIPLTKDLLLVEFVYLIIGNLSIKTDKRYPNTIFYHVDDNVYFEQESMNIFWCRITFWIDIKIKYLLNNNEITVFIKIMLEYHLKCEVKSIASSAMYI